MPKTVIQYVLGRLKDIGIDEISGEQDPRVGFREHGFVAVWRPARALDGDWQRPLRERTLIGGRCWPSSTSLQALATRILGFEADYRAEPRPTTGASRVLTSIAGSENSPHDLSRFNAGEHEELRSLIRRRPAASRAPSRSGARGSPPSSRSLDRQHVLALVGVGEAVVRGTCGGVGLEGSGEVLGLDHDAGLRVELHLDVHLVAGGDPGGPAVGVAQAAEDFAFPVEDAIVQHPGINYLGCCNELNAGYAADGYARIRGVGALTTTYGVGGTQRDQRPRRLVRGEFSVFHLTGMPITVAQHKRDLVHHTLGLVEDVVAPQSQDTPAPLHIHHAASSEQPHPAAHAANKPC